MTMLRKRGKEKIRFRVMNSRVTSKDTELSEILEPFLEKDENSRQSCLNFLQRRETRLF